MHPPYKQRLVDQINITLEKRLFLLKTTKWECLEWYFIMKDYYTDIAYRERKSLGATTEYEDWLYERTKTTEALPAEVRP